MKRLPALLSLSFATHFAFGQNLVENKIDEFTKKTVKITDWNIVSKTMKIVMYARTTQINDTSFLNIKVMTGEVESISVGNKLMFILSNDSIVSLENLKYQISCSGCGAIGFSGSEAPGLDLAFPVLNEELKNLKSFTIKKLRIYFNDGYIETDVKEKFQSTIKNELLLL